MCDVVKTIEMQHKYLLLSY